MRSRAAPSSAVPETNSLDLFYADVRAQQSTARQSISPAVLSLVLVSLALLMRLLMAASEIRVPELALASLRGVSSARLWLLGLAEPFVVLIAAVPLGIGFGVGLGALLTRQWLVPGLPLPLPALSWVAAALVLLAAIVVAFVAVGMVVRDTLASQLSGVRRPRASRRWSLVAQLTLVALALSALVSKLSASGQSAPDLTDMLLPMLLAIVAGLAATRLTAWAATWWTKRRARTRSLGAFVSARAISRRQEGTLVILPVTAAIAVAVFGAGVYDSAATWRGGVAATASPAAATWSSALPLRETRDLTHALDPEGQWLMAAAYVLNPGASFAVVDGPRLATVATWPETWSPGRSVEEIADDIALPGAVPELVGRRLSITVDNQAQTSGELGVEARLRQRRRRAGARLPRTVPRGGEHPERQPAEDLPHRLPARRADAGRQRRVGDRDGRLGTSAVDRGRRQPSWTTRSRAPPGRRPRAAARSPSIATIDSSGDSIDLTFAGGDGAAWRA